MRTSSLVIDTTPFLTFNSPHRSWVRSLVSLSDGSFVSCSKDQTVRRWMMKTKMPSYSSNNNKDRIELELVGTFVGHDSYVWCAIEKDRNTLLSGSEDQTLKEWDVTSCQCLNTHEIGSPVWSLVITKDRSTVVCGLETGRVEMRRASDLDLKFSFSVHSGTVYCICELEEGSFASGSYDKTIKIWKERRVLHILSGHSSWVHRVIELNNNTIVSTSGDKTVKIWKRRQCIHTLTPHSETTYGLVRLSGNKFATGSIKSMIHIWTEEGECLQTIQTNDLIDAMTRVGDVIVTANSNILEIRQMRLVSPLIKGTPFNTPLPLKGSHLWSCVALRYPRTRCSTISKISRGFYPKNCFCFVLVAIQNNPNLTTGQREVQQQHYQDYVIIGCFSQTDPQLGRQGYIWWSFVSRKTEKVCEVSFLLFFFFFSLLLPYFILFFFLFTSRRTDSQHNRLS